MPITYVICMYVMYVRTYVDCNLPLIFILVFRSLRSSSIYGNDLIFSLAFGHTFLLRFTFHLSLFTTIASRSSMIGTRDKVAFCLSP